MPLEQRQQGRGVLDGAAEGPEVAAGGDGEGLEALQDLVSLALRLGLEGLVVEVGEPAGGDEAEVDAAVHCPARDAIEQHLLDFGHEGVVGEGAVVGVAGAVEAGHHAGLPDVGPEVAEVGDELVEPGVVAGAAGGGAFRAGVEREEAGVGVVVLGLEAQADGAGVLVHRGGEAVAEVLDDDVGKRRQGTRGVQVVPGEEHVDLAGLGEVIGAELR